MVMWHAEHTVDTSAAPEEVWRRLESVADWPQWDEGVTWAELTGDFSAGSQGRLRLNGEGTRTFRLAKVVANRTFTALVKVPLAEIRHTHDQQASSMGTRMTHSIEISGPLSWFYGLVQGQRLREGLAPSLRSLARVAADRKN